MRVGQGRKLNVPGINPIVSVVGSGAAHKLERAPFDVVKRSYALRGFLPAGAAKHTDTNISAASETCADVSSTPVATCG